MEIVSELPAGEAFASKDRRVVAELTLSGSTVRVGYDDTASDPSVFMELPEEGEEATVFMSPCEAHLLIAAVGAALCQTTGKDHL
jgi:hypothetical protein